MKRVTVRGLDLLLVPPRVEASLWRRLRFERELRCRELIFRRYRSLARSVAASHYRRRPHTVEVGDLEQFAYEGLLEAIDRFDPLRGAPFSSYARRRISGSIADGASRMNEKDAQYSYRARVERDRARSLAPAVSEGEDPLRMLADLASGLALGLMLEGTGVVAPEDGIDPRPGAYESLAWREMQSLLARELERLPEREAILLRQHYEHGVTFARIAQLLGVSTGRVSQLHAAALAKLRARIGAGR